MPLRTPRLGDHGAVRTPHPGRAPGPRAPDGGTRAGESRRRGRAGCVGS
ncbi:hypothetical protein CZ771_04935 [Actinomycetales bacterium JB111]|nr:hypothetical protein CZ771_04935 [Actinomycetales bacterium JB111]